MKAAASNDIIPSQKSTSDHRDIAAWNEIFLLRNAEFGASQVMIADELRYGRAFAEQNGLTDERELLVSENKIAQLLKSKSEGLPAYPSSLITYDNGRLLISRDFLSDSYLFEMRKGSKEINVRVSSEAAKDLFDQHRNAAELPGDRYLSIVSQLGYSTDLKVADRFVRCVQADVINTNSDFSFNPYLALSSLNEADRAQVTARMERIACGNYLSFKLEDAMNRAAKFCPGLLSLYAADLLLCPEGFDPSSPSLHRVLKPLLSFVYSFRGINSLKSEIVERADRLSKSSSAWLEGEGRALVAANLYRHLNFLDLL